MCANCKGGLTKQRLTSLVTMILHGFKMKDEDWQDIIIALDELREHYDQTRNPQSPKSPHPQRHWTA